MIHRYGERPDGPFVEIESERLNGDEGFFSGRFSPWVQATWGTLALDGAERIQEATGRVLVAHLEAHRADDRSPNVVFLLHEDAKRRGKGRSSAVPWLSTDVGLPPVRLPPLRQRRDDIPLLAAYFLQAQRAAGHTPARSIGAKAMERLEAHDWPGNVGELRNALEFAALQTAVADSIEVGIEHLPAGLGTLAPRRGRRASEGLSDWDYRRHVAHAELDLAERTIRERGISQKAALVRALVYSDRFTLTRRIRKALDHLPATAEEFPALTQLFQGTRRR